MVLGLTGGIASGKSTVANIFRELGARVVSADELAREVVRPGSVTLQEIVARFGPEVLDEAGNLNRRMMAERIFSNRGERAALNRITHPAIARLAARRFREMERAGARLIVYDAPLLFEAGAAGQVDAVLVVTIAPDRQLKRGDGPHRIPDVPGGKDRPGRFFDRQFGICGGNPAAGQGVDGSS
jgi:dephospho-CoA kinase